MTNTSSTNLDVEAAGGDGDLADLVRQQIAQAFAGEFPQDVTITVDDKRVRLLGTVEDVDTVERITKAAAVTPGILGIHNELQTRQPAPPASEEPAPQSQGKPLDPPYGQINHKV
jgi:osmotically-inducible protein OsmY